MTARAPEVRPATPDDVPALVAAYEWRFAPPGSRAPGWDAGAAATVLRELLEDDERFAAFVGADGDTVAGS